MVIAIFGNTLRPETIREVRHIVEFLQLRGVEIVLSQELRHEAFNREFISVEDYISQTGETIDFALSVGGDGSFLTTASLVGHLDIPILGINCGHLGYLAEVQTEDIDAVLDQLITNNYTIEKRRMLEVSCQYDNKIVLPYALNEVAVLKSGLSSMITVDVMLNGEFLHKYKADGLLIATSFGSTAYNLSFGGSIVYNTFDTLQITPIAPLNNKSYRNLINSVIIPTKNIVTIEPNSNDNNLLITIDGKNIFLNEVEKINIVINDKNINIIRKRDYNFISSGFSSIASKSSSSIFLSTA